MSGSLLLCDTPGLLYRGFFALPDSIKGAEGRPVNALIGSVNMTLWCVEKYQPREDARWIDWAARHHITPCIEQWRDIPMANDPKTQRPTLTTAAGIPVGDNQNSLTAGPRGPLPVQDWQLFEKHAHFNRERIPERVVHAKGSAAYGTLTITKDITRHTKAKLFAEVGKKTDVLLRFSTVAGEKGAADAERDVRGFALKFYTEEGNWDLVGNNTPVFFVRDPYKFPDFIHTQKRDPRTTMRSATAMWDFWSLSPESLHQVTILFSDRGLPRNYRQMHGFGSHTYSFINANDERVWVKFHFKSMQGIANVSDAQQTGNMLTVTVNSGAMATVNGVTVSNISISRSGS